MNHTRILLLTAIALGALAIACGGSGDDDDDNGGEATSTPTSGSASTPGGGGETATVPGGNGGEAEEGTLVVDGKTYDLEIESCDMPTGPAGAIGIAGKIEGRDDSPFGAGGLGNVVSFGFTVDGKQYVMAGAQLEIDGDEVSYEGDAVDANAGTVVRASFRISC